MSCINPPHLDIGDIPGLSALLGDFVINPPDLSVDFCCRFDVITPPIEVPIGAILESLVVTPADATNYDNLLNLVGTAVSTINTLLDELSFDCPLS